MNITEVITLKKIPLTFDAEKHVYELGGVGWIPGVTTICGLLPQPWLAPWMVKSATEYITEHWKEGVSYSAGVRDQIIKDAKSAHKRKSTEAKDRGHDAHEWIEKWIKKEETPVLDIKSPEAWAVGQFLEWAGVAKPEWLFTELRVASTEYQYAGTLDAVARIEGKLWLIDFKTSARPSPTWQLQTAAYKRALSEMGLDVFGRAVVRIPKEGRGGFYPILSDYDRDLKAFLVCKELYAYINSPKLDNEVTYE